MILLRALDLTNFLSHENTTLPFSEQDQVLIDGISGSGKSSLFDAIIFALFACGRADNRSLIRKGESSATVTLGLYDTVKKEEISITRTCTIKGKHSVSVIINGTPLGISGVKEVQQWIEKELIGCSYLLFVNSVAYVQGGADVFISQPPARRKELLLEIIKADNFDSYYEKAKNILLEIKNTKDLLTAKEGMLKAQIDEYNAEIKEEDVLNEHKKNATLVLSEIETLKKEKTVKIEGLKQIKAKIDSYGPFLSGLMENWESKKSRVEDLEKKRELKKKWEAEIAENTGLGDKKNVLTKKIITLREEIHEMENYMKKKPEFPDYELGLIEKKKSYIKNVIDKREKCPSGDLCPYYKTTIEGKKKEEEEIKELETKAEAAVRARLEWDEGAKKYRGWEDHMAKLSEAEEDLLDVRQRIKEVAQMDSELATMTSLENDYLAAVEARNEIVVKIHDIKEARKAIEESFNEQDLLAAEDELTGLIVKERQANETLSKIEIGLHQVQRAKEKKEQKYKELAEFEKDLKTLEEKERISLLIKEAFGNKGIKTIAIDYLLPKLEDKINEVLDQLADFRVRLDSQKMTVDGEGVVEGLFITIQVSAGHSLDVELLSGGERTKLVVAFSEALASLQRCGWRLLDENLIALDSESLEALLESLRHLQKKYPQVLCISHIPEVKDCFDSSVACTKHMGITKISIPF